MCVRRVEFEGRFESCARRRATIPPHLTSDRVNIVIVYTYLEPARFGARKRVNFRVRKHSKVDVEFEHSEQHSRQVSRGHFRTLDFERPDRARMTPDSGVGKLLSRKIENFAKS